MKENELKMWGKRLAYVLRHHPENFALEMDKNGWVSVDALITAFQNMGPFDRNLLDAVVAADNKGRFSYNGDKTLIRANQGHSIQVDVELKEKLPPAVLYHGTGVKYVESINHQGLLPKGRLYVHLSVDLETAENVGKRHGVPYVYQINTVAMVNDGHKFYLSANGIWLTKHVPAKYLVGIALDIG